MHCPTHVQLHSHMHKYLNQHPAFPSLFKKLQKPVGEATLQFFKRLYLFLERGEGGEKEGEKHQCVVACHVAPTRDWQPRHVP